MKRLHRLLLPFLLAPFVSGPATAWPVNGLRVTGARDDQVGPQIVGDAAGGAFISWADFRDFFGAPSDGTDLYLQHVTASGQIAPGWPVDGLAIRAGPGVQGSNWRMMPDGNSGVLIVFGEVFSDPRNDPGDLFLQRVTASGAVAAGWPAGGLPIAVGPGRQYVPEIAGDGSGGAFVSWQDGNDPATTRAWFTHILSTGQVAPGWPPEGRLFEPSAPFVLRPLMLATAAGGFLACWPVSDDTLRTVRLLGQRFGPDGTPDGLWGAGGVLLCPPQPSHRVPRDRLMPDGSGGFFTVFSDYRNSPPSSPFAEEDLYIQHVLGSGAVGPGWPADALPVVLASGQGPSLSEDGHGGVFVAWEDYRSNYARIFGQHLDAGAQRHAGWPAEGLSLSDRFAYQLSPHLAWDGMSGMYVTWMNAEPDSVRSYASYLQHFSANGTPFAGWVASGLPVIPLHSDQYVPQVTADGQGGAIVAWEDIRGGGRDIYAQRYSADGVVATQVSLASAEAVPGEVRVRWQVSGETRASVERHEGDVVWQVLSELTADGTGQMELVDRDVRAGLRYHYRLAFASGTRGGDVSLLVPERFALSLEGARPNPAQGALWVAFTLPDASPARLELFDLAGRQVASRAVGARVAGEQVVRLDDGALAPGLYWASLTHGGRTLRSRVAVFR